MKKAFTLVELLVMIAIIIVLLALLAPALDRAIYQAELAACGAKLDGIAASVIGEAVRYQRLYPARTAAWYPHQIAHANGADDRPGLRRYLPSLNGLLLDPLAPAAVDLEFSDSDASVFSSYYLFFGWRYTAAEGGPGMRRLGDRWTYGGRTYDVLAQDYDTPTGPQEIWGSHADRQNLMVPAVARYGEDGSDQIFAAYRGPKRSAIDVNVLYQDGSVRRISDVKPHDPATRVHDERFDPVPHFYNSNQYDTLRGYVPRGR